MGGVHGSCTYLHRASTESAPLSSRASIIMLSSGSDGSPVREVRQGRAHFGFGHIMQPPRSNGRLRHTGLGTGPWPSSANHAATESPSGPFRTRRLARGLGGVALLLSLEDVRLARVDADLVGRRAAQHARVAQPRRLLRLRLVGGAARAVVAALEVGRLGLLRQHPPLLLLYRQWARTRVVRSRLGRLSTAC